MPRRERIEIRLKGEGGRARGHNLQSFATQLPLCPWQHGQGVNGKLANIIKELSTNTAMGVDGACGSAGGRKTVIIMDEVDGMSGSDRGGISDLIKIIAKSKASKLARHFPPLSIPEFPPHLLFTLALVLVPSSPNALLSALTVPASKSLPPSVCVYQNPLRCPSAGADCVHLQ